MGYCFELTPTIVRHLQVIERVRETVRLTIIPPALVEHLRFQALIRSTHYSTKIEGNRLTLKETEAVVRGGRQYPGRERDVLEVKHYYDALQQVEAWAEAEWEINEERVRKLHAILYSGKQAKSTSYRDGQNVIRDGTGGIVYMPPEAADVPSLMQELFTWIHDASGELPVPVIAGVAHYQFETIHPFYDGNGRAGRMLTTWILHQGGYDLGKLYALEEFYADDLRGYYNALVTHPHHNYYFGRHEADITSWLEYFLEGMAVSFERLAETIREQAQDNLDQADLALLRPLDHRARRVLGLFVTRELIRSSDVANLLGLSMRQARDLLAQWVDQGWLEIADPAKRSRSYRLHDAYRKLVT